MLIATKIEKEISIHPSIKQKHDLLLYVMISTKNQWR